MSIHHQGHADDMNGAAETRLDTHHSGVIHVLRCNGEVLDVTHSSSLSDTLIQSIYLRGTTTAYNKQHQQKQENDEENKEKPPRDHVPGPVRI